WRSISTDEGRTFSQPELTNLRNPNAGVHLTMSTSGRLLLAYNDSCARTVIQCRCTDCARVCFSSYYSWELDETVYI
ncbi:exo-alpha-sialidase, partial [bacterium]|nr:exo-alpha-sialidase [bacterium]